MALVDIPINKGYFPLLPKQDGKVSGHAVEFKNLMLSKTGSNVDRPGRRTFATIGGYPVQGLFFYEPANRLVAVTQTDRKIWSIDSAGTVTEITGAAVLEGSSRPVFDEDGSYLAIAGGGEPKQWSGTGNTASLAGSPADTKFISYLDGYWLYPIPDDQEMRWAGPTLALRQSFSSSNFFQAEGLPDDIKAQKVLLRQLYLFGSKSTEIFQNFGDSSVPFRRSFFLEEGISAPHSVIKWDNTLFWLDSKRRFVRLEGNTPVQKSLAIQPILDAMETVDDCWGSPMKFGDFDLLMWVFPTEERCFVLDLANGEWYEWDGFEDGESQKMPIHSHAFSSTWNKHFVGDPDTGIIYELSLDFKSDGDQVLRRLRRTGQYTHGSNQRKRSRYYLVDVKRGVGTVGETEPRLLMRVNDDNQGWTDYVEVTLGYPGESAEPIRVDDLGGIYVKRELDILMTDEVELQLNSVQEDVEGMTS